MTTTALNHSAATAVPQFALAGSFLEGLAAQDFARLGDALTADVRLRALLPGGLREWTGAETIADVFASWFGDAEDFDLVEATVGEVGGRLHLRWRLRLQAQRLGSGWFTVEQQVYADTADSGRIARLDLLCTGYRPEGTKMTDTLATWGGWAPAIRDDPFGHFAEARARCPVQKARLADGHPAWVVLGYDAARQALNDPRISKDMLAALQDNGDVVAEGLPGPEFSRHMLNVDPPDHTRLRRLVSRAFAPPRIAALEPAIRAIASNLLDELDAAGPGATVDLIEGYAYPLPFGVISELLGIPEADRPRLHAWFQVLLTGWAGDPPPEAVEASDGIVAYLRELVGAKRQSPAGDLVSVLVAAEDDALTTQELLSSLFQLVVAGHDTTASLIGNGVVALLDHPGQLEALLADPGRLPAAIDELIRFTAPVPHATFRVTTEPVTLDGVEIPPHEQVLVMPGLGQPRSGSLPGARRAGHRPPRRAEPRVRPRDPLLPRRAAGPARSQSCFRRAARPSPGLAAGCRP